LRDLRAVHPRLAERGYQELAPVARAYKLSKTPVSPWRIFAMFLFDKLRWPWRRLRRSIATLRSGATAAVAAEAIASTDSLRAILWRRAIHPWSDYVLGQWRRAHIVFCTIMVATSIVHIWVAFRYSM